MSVTMQGGCINHLTTGHRMKFTLTVLKKRRPDEPVAYEYKYAGLHLIPIGNCPKHRYHLSVRRMDYRRFIYSYTSKSVCRF